MIEQLPCTYRGHRYTITSTSESPLINIDDDLLSLIIEQNNTIIQQNQELLSHLRNLRNKTTP